MAVKIKLKRLGKIRQPQYRIVVADSRTKRDGRAIEEIGLYHPMEQPSLIQVDSERVQYWLGVGAQPTESVTAILKVTGDWQKFKGLPGAEGTLQMPAAKPDRKALYEAAAKEAADEPATEATTPKAKRVAKAEEADLEAAATQQAEETAGVEAMTEAEAVVEQAAEEVVAEAAVAEAAADEAAAESAESSEA
ncbi:MAG: 30S ribosomal protein S16 [Candidatus Nanopelagicales bacterium]